jgi:hypothetical protein
VIRHCSSITLNDRKAFYRDSQFLSGKLPVNSGQPRPRIDSAGEDRDRAIGVKGEEAIEVNRRGAGCATAALLSGILCRQDTAEREANHKRATGFQQVPTRNSPDAHFRPPSALAARITAFRIRV